MNFSTIMSRTRVPLRLTVFKVHQHDDFSSRSYCSVPLLTSSQERCRSSANCEEVALLEQEGHDRRLIKCVKNSCCKDTPGLEMLERQGYMPA